MIAGVTESAGFEVIVVERKAGTNESSAVQLFVAAASLPEAYEAVRQHRPDYEIKRVSQVDQPFLVVHAAKLN